MGYGHYGENQHFLIGHNKLRNDPLDYIRI